MMIRGIECLSHLCRPKGKWWVCFNAYLMNGAFAREHMDVESQPPIARGWRIFFNTNHANFWYGLIVIGILMRLFGSLISSLHVDTHMHVAYATNFVEIGVFELEWGPDKNQYIQDE